MRAYRGPHPAGRPLHHQRSVRRQHAPARHRARQADLPRRRLIGFSVALAHMTDIGGRIPGGNASDSTEIYQEGLRIPPSRLWREGEPDETMFRLIERNVRVPDKVLGDIRSLVAACVVGEREMKMLARALRRGRVRAVLPRPPRLHRALHARGDRQAAQGHVDASSTTSTATASIPHPIRIEATVTIRADSMTIDLTGSVAAGARRDQLRLSVHAVDRAGLRALDRGPRRSPTTRATSVRSR